MDNNNQTSSQQTTTALNPIPPDSAQQPFTNPPPLNPPPPEITNKPIVRSKLLYLIPVILVLLLSLSIGTYYLASLNKSQTDEPVAPTTGACGGVDMATSRNISHPKTSREILLFTGLLNTDLEFETQNWYRLPEGITDERLNKQGDGSLHLIVLGKNGEIIGRVVYDTDKMFTMHTDPGGAIAVKVTPIANALPYTWDARYISLENNGNILYKQQIQLKLLQSAIDTLPDDIYINNKADFNNSAVEILKIFTECVAENEIAASRILEFKLLPLVETELSVNVNKEILETNKEELVELIRNIAARLDPAITTAEITLTPTPILPSNIQLRENIKDKSSTNAYLSLGKGVRFGDQIQLELKEVNYPDTPIITPWPQGLIANNEQEEYAKVIVTDIATGQNREFVFYKEKEEEIVYGFKLNVSSFSPHINSITFWVSHE